MLPQNSFYSIFDVFDDIFHGFLTEDTPSNLPYPSFPPCDVEVDPDSKDLSFQFALAGYPKENINISFEDDVMKLDVNKVEDSNNKKSLRKTIKRSGFSAKYAIPQSRYEVDKAKAEYDNGILEVLIPAREEAKPKTLLIS